MSHRYLLDTNILSDLVRNPAGRVTERIAEVGEQTVCTSVIVAAELHFGALKKGSERLSHQVDKVLSALDTLPLEPACVPHYAEIRLALEQCGQPIGANDLLIAAHARACGLILVTHNCREFDRVPEMHTQDWLA